MFIRRNAEEEQQSGYILVSGIWISGMLLCVLQACVYGWSVFVVYLVWFVNFFRITERFSYDHLRRMKRSCLDTKQTLTLHLFVILFTPPFRYPGFRCYYLVRG